MLLISMLFSAGCAFVDKQVSLNPVDAGLPEPQAIGGSLRLTIRDQRRPDLRPLVGHVKNGYGMKTAGVVSDREPAAWLADCISREMARAGVQVHLARSEQDSSPSARELALDLTKCYVQAYWNFGAEVSVRMTLKVGERTFFSDREYFGKAINGKRETGTAVSYQATLELAMGDLLAKLIPDLLKAMNS